jgi:short-subunit dehydrogenase
MQLGGRTALVTGATGGIGVAIARALAERGTGLILTGRRGGVLDEVAGELDARALTCDLSVRDDVERLAGEALAAGVDVLVANAALPGSGLLTDLTQDEIDRILEVNLRAPIALARALAPSMIQRGSGHMVFISSLSGKTTSPASSLYSATKFGLRGFGLGLREDLRAHGVGVSLVFPGFIREAGMFADADVKLPFGVGTRSPQDVANAVIRAIQGNRAEVDVAPLGLRLGAVLGGVAPAFAASAARRMGAHEIASNMARGQSDKR